MPRIVPIVLVANTEIGYFKFWKYLKNGILALFSSKSEIRFYLGFTVGEEHDKINQRFQNVFDAEADGASVNCQVKLENAKPSGYNSKEKSNDTRGEKPALELPDLHYSC